MTDGHVSNADAAEQVLRRHSPGAPLHYRRIAELAIEDGLISTSGATPDATMNAAITQEIKRRDSSGEPQRFRHASRALYALASPTDPLGGAIDRHNAEVRGRLRNVLSQMDPFAFEHLIGQLLAALGFEDVEVTRRSNDGGIDVRATLTVEGVTDVRTAVQVKRWSNAVSGKTVREVRGGLGSHERGLIITLSDFTPDARRDAGQSDRVPISLVNGERLISLLVENSIGVSARRVSLLELDEASLRPSDDEAPEDVVPDEDSRPGATPVPRARSRYTGTRGLWTWPLPGGRNAFKATLDRMLRHVASAAPTLPLAVQWLIGSYDRVRSENVAANYWRVPRAFGLLELSGEQLALTAEGARYLESPTNEALLDVLDMSVVGFTEIREHLRGGLLTAEQLRELLCQELGLAWTTDAQVLWRLHWLEGLLVVRAVDSQWALGIK
jgi:hypothetical protein